MPQVHLHVNAGSCLESLHETSLMLMKLRCVTAGVAVETQGLDPGDQAELTVAAPATPRAASNTPGFQGLQAGTLPHDSYMTLHVQTYQDTGKTTSVPRCKQIHLCQSAMHAPSAGHVCFHTLLAQASQALLHHAQWQQICMML